jgi:hypothetical protein
MALSRATNVDGYYHCKLLLDLRKVDSVPYLRDLLREMVIQAVANVTFKVRPYRSRKGEPGDFALWHQKFVGILEPDSVATPKLFS